MAGAEEAEAEGAGVGDLAHARSERFQRRVEAALECVRAAIAYGPIGVSFSGGKDSTVVLDLVRRVAPDSLAAFFHSGAELQSTLDLVAAYDVETIHPRLTMQELARYAGWWGHAPIDPDASFDAKMILIQEPAETFVVRRGLRAIAEGIRAEESTARARYASKGPLYLGADGTWVLMPILRWSVEDVWAYIASRGLRYNAAYDRMSALGIERRLQRIGGTLGERGSGWGRHEILRQIEPETWTKLRAEFPLLGVTA